MAIALSTVLLEEEEDMKQLRFKEAFLGFTKEKLKEQIDELLSAMIIKDQEHREYITGHLTDYLAASIRARNIRRRTRNLPDIRDLSDLPIYLIASLVKKSNTYREFKGYLTDAFKNREDSYFAGNVNNAVKALGNFPWAWKFDPGNNKANDQPASQKAAARDNDQPLATLAGIKDMLSKEWPEMKSLLDAGEYEYNEKTCTFFILPSFSTLQDHRNKFDALSRLLSKRFKGVTVDILDPGPPALPEPEGLFTPVPTAAGMEERTESLGETPPTPIGHLQGNPWKARNACWRDGITAEDREDIGTIMSRMKFKTPEERKRAYNKIYRSLYKSAGFKNEARVSKGLDPIHYAVKDLQIYIFSEIVATSYDADTFLSSLQNNNLLSSSYKRIGLHLDLPWDWKFDPHSIPGYSVPLPAAGSAPEPAEREEDPFSVPVETSAPTVDSPENPSGFPISAPASSVKDTKDDSDGLDQATIERILKMIDAGATYKTIEQKTGISRYDIGFIRRYYRKWFEMGAQNVVDCYLALQKQLQEEGKTVEGKTVTTGKESARMAELQELKTRYEALNAAFRQHIHAVSDGSAYVPLDDVSVLDKRRAS